MKSLRRYIRAALAIMLGERCAVCGEFLPGGMVCERCYLEFPFINIRGERGNAIERCFWGLASVARASAMVSYRPGAPVGKVLHTIKYHGGEALAVEMGRRMAGELSGTDFFEGIDAIMAVPLHPSRERERGYNQSRCLARGIAEVTGLRVVDCVRRTVDNVSQTTLSHEARGKNVEGIFAAEREVMEKEGLKHVLVVDDVITTGATMKSCIRAMMTCKPKGLKVSVLAFAYAGALHVGRLMPEDQDLSHCVGNEEFRELQEQALS